MCAFKVSKKPNVLNLQFKFCPLPPLDIFLYTPFGLSAVQQVPARHCTMLFCFNFDNVARLFTVKKKFDNNIHLDKTTGMDTCVL